MITIYTYRIGSIIKLDFDFNKIKSIGSFGSCYIQLNSPMGICCKDGILNICDNGDQRVKNL